MIRLASELSPSKLLRFDTYSLVTAIRTIVETAPEELDRGSAPLEDGTRHFDSAAFLRWLAALPFNEIDFDAGEFPI